MLKVDLVGLGHWGQKYKKLLASYDVSLNLIDPPKGITEKKRESDAAIIATPASTHYQIAKEYLEKGKDILVEKPLALSLKESEKLIRLAKEHQSILMVGHTYLYNPAIQYIKEHVGDLYFILANRTHLGLVRGDVDCIWDLAPHDISIANYILNAEPLNGSVVKGYYLSSKRCDIGFITLKYPKNVLCNITVGWLSATKVRTVEFVGENERTVFDDLNPLERVKIYKRGVHLMDDKISLRDGEIVSPNIKYYEPLRLQIDDFLNSVRTRKQPLANGEAGLKVVRAIENLKEVREWYPK